MTKPSTPCDASKLEALNQQSKGAPTYRSVPVQGGATTEGVWSAPEEIPVAFVYNGRNYAVMLASPSDYEDFAVGFSLTERVIDDLGDITNVDVRVDERGAELHLAIDPAKLERLDIRQQRRNLVGRAGCGVCGLENAETFFERLPHVDGGPLSIGSEALIRALTELPDHQPLSRETRTVHAAALATVDGEIQLVREDVGRHNALDKLLGALARKGVTPQDGFVLMTSRCSYEIIEKSARFGVRAVACVSGPTAFATRKAAEAGIALYCREGDAFVRVGAPE